MPEFAEETATSAAPPTQLAPPEFSILKQRVDLDVDFAHKSLKGSTEITVQPLVKDLKQIRLHCRQCRPASVQASGMTAKWTYDDSYRLSTRTGNRASVFQHEMLKERIHAGLRPAPQPEFVIQLPAKLKIQELHVDPATALPLYNADTAAPSLQQQESDAMAILETPTAASAAQQQGPHFAPIKLQIEFEVSSFRDGIHWVGCDDEDRRFPYMYTKVEPWAGNTSCIFPCVDDTTSRCSWEIAISCPRTVGDAFRLPKQQLQNSMVDAGKDNAPSPDVQMSNGVESTKIPIRSQRESAQYSIDLSEPDAALDLTIVCSGETVDDVVDSEDDSRHTVTFSQSQPVAARHVGFAIGPFEHVDLSTSRNTEDEERLGQSATKVDGYCLPGRDIELRNTCLPIAWAVDFISVNVGSFPFTSYQMVFVDDFTYDTVAVAGLSFCSSNLLFPKTVIEPIDRNTRILVRTLAEQWSGVHILPKEAQDAWVVAGIAGFLTDLYMKRLAGNNEFRWQQKLAAEKVYDLDVDRPSLRMLGELLHLDYTIRDFVNMKSALVLFILDRRLMKASGSTGVQRIINKLFLNAKTGTLANGELSTADFQRMCERLGHNKLDSFFRQWVFGSGCPIFYVTQRFNKKKLVVEMTIVQKQVDRVTKPPFDPSNFMREIKEHVRDVWAPETNPAFTGPMTIRIHEADGTPYEHIVEIKEATTRLEIPYNTKYKRLKRSRRQKERQIAEGATGEGGDDALLYCLGDILDTEEERKEWDLIEWTEDDEEKMGQESYEWIRMDADFEWIGKIHLVMPLYMYISQLQQDRDLVAQYESMRYLLGSNPHHVNLTILVRTLMDPRYFWGIREMAAEGLAICAKDSCLEKGQFHLLKSFRELFCLSGDVMPKPNDFSDRRNFIIQCAILRALAKLRDRDDKVPMKIRRCFIDLLKFNDNSNNRVDDGGLESTLFSDAHYIATLMNCLADSLVASHRPQQPSYDFSFGEEDLALPPEYDPERDFEQLAITQIDRHRRIDEWDPSYHNIYSTTALGCLQRLAKAGIVKKTAEVMKYVQQGNADNVRLAAYRCLSETGVLRNMAAMRFLLHQLVEDPSPHFRDRLLRIFGEALGHIALEDPEIKKESQPTTETENAALVLEQETSNETRRLEVTRKTTPEGALAALKASLQDEDNFKEALWYAMSSPDISLDEVAALCDTAALVFEPVTSCIVALKLPRMYACKNMGQGKVKFIPRGPCRQTPRKELELVDWQRMQYLGLTYTGPLSAEVVKRQKEQQRTNKEAQLKLKILQAQLQIEHAQAGGLSAGDMPPPLPTVTPGSEKVTGIKLSLGAKRKQSMDLTSRPGSPKAQKVSQQQTPPVPKLRESPVASSLQRLSTQSSKPPTGKPKIQKIVKLRFHHHADKAQQILSSPSQANRKGQTSLTPVSQTVPHPSPSATAVVPQGSMLGFGVAQSPTNSMNYFSGPAFRDPSASQPAMNLGAFRSYGPLATAEPTIESPDESAEELKKESFEKEPTTLPGPSLSISPTQTLQQQDMLPPPRPKITLKLGAGSRQNSIQGSPE